MFDERLKVCAALTDAELHGTIRALGSEPLHEAMLYACTGGKRLRAFLVMESAALFGIADAVSVKAAAAVEAMHAYSLVHDDLPAMDDDDLRRGQPTVHKKWDEAMAILVGDALQALAYDFVTDEALGAARLNLISGMAHASGAHGMVLGQARDIEGETKLLNMEQVMQLQALKTGALITWSATAGAVIAGKDTALLKTYAAAFGLAFQIIDDILDIEAPEGLGKTPGKDQAQGKATFVSLMGLEAARKRAEALILLAKGALASYGERAGALQAAADFVLTRKS
jgi:farnesyl diphosphate synthase